ncbi:hypothetical protein BU26DRAFT_568255 [Trematosphaeria pertusa]|uniref:Carbonic anhydrase n=1 Tax=Trematosphaeria pertusa TaxID=390896 RepID=A0A6A6I6J5_9PLEO|nr:uncharacterized protein BU26DRAFT_568255 [Trematosphaeria pertusa]KAF2245698.1 hypothetical protein BU26DRAFT_568255 [Trematosphaeria pertusa]
MDQRVHPEEFLGLQRGDVPVIRNAGGRARRAVLDAAFLDALITITDIIVIHHTNCGLTLMTDEKVSKALGERSTKELAKHDIDGYCITE